MSQQIRNGLIDYLEIMQISGVAELGAPVKRAALDVEPVSEEVETILEEPEKPEESEEPEKEERTTEIIQEITSVEIAPVEITPVEIISEEKTETATEEIVKEVTAKEITEEIMSDSPVHSDKTERLRLLARKVAQCSRCSELASTRTQTVFGVGNPDTQLVFLGEAPGADEDKQGEPFVGRAGKLLNDIITKGMKIRREDVYICNILRCRPPGNRNPSTDEAEHCRTFLDQTLDIIKPTFICCLGSVAAQNLLQTEKTIGSMRGKIFDYNGIKVICTYHPAYLLRNPSAKKQTWDDIKLLMNEMGLPISNEK
ncbi:MAG: uracil-DNA glycosylase [Planctomycetaceae bacterium]|jgi:DNA polymerase|nr:uracil-DNA glycosylase [Planctomycetaceae bacterium]